MFPLPTSAEGSGLVFTGLTDARGKIKIRGRVAEWTDCLIAASATPVDAQGTIVSRGASATAVPLAR